MTRTPVESSSVKALGYDADAQVLEVEYKVREGKPPSIYRYEGVAPSVYAQLTEPGVSIGSLVNKLKADPTIRVSRLEPDEAA